MAAGAHTAPPPGGWEQRLPNWERPLPPLRTGAAAPARLTIRLAAFAALTLDGTLTWAGQVEPRGRGAMLAATAAACALAGVLIAAPRLSRRRAAAAIAAAAFIAMLVIASAVGIPARLLAPDAWPDLAGGIGQGLQALPDLRVPYRGADEWVRAVVLGGGGLLALLAAALAFAPARDRAGFPHAAAVALGVLFAVPVVENGPRHPFLAGALFAVLLAAFLWAERLRGDQAPIAAAITGLAILLALALAPQLDARRPWIDYEHLADRLRAAPATRFDWNHRYTALDWPRDGREVLRVQTSASAYWRGVALDDFDGLRWRHAERRDVNAPDTEINRDHPEWRKRVTVVVRNMTSRQLFAPGTLLGVTRLGRNTLSDGDGTFVTAGRPLHAGDAYVADVYAPRPSETDLRGAGQKYPDFARGQLGMALPASVGGPVTANPHTGRFDSGAVDFIQFPAWGTDERTWRITPDGFAYRDGRSAILASDYRRMYRLAQRLRAQSSSPYDLVQRVSRRVRRGATYSEAPPPARLPLDAFLFTDHAGYCQQFSGAMALLLRMAGVPARVASGFAPGRYDPKRREYVVRDLDAHSWVEVYFPRIGWVPFDPTPASAPPTAQASGDSVPSAAGGDATDSGALGDRASDPHAGGRASAGDGHSWLVPAAVVALALAALGAALVTRRLRGRPAALGDGLDELRRALERTGRPLTAEVTLQRLEARMAGEAQAYVRALRLARYGGGFPAPTRAQRAALRHELGAGLGLRGRLRALSALPPTLRRRPAWTTSTSSSATAPGSSRTATSTPRPSR